MFSYIYQSTGACEHCVMCTSFVDTYRNIFHAATDIHLLVFFIFKGSVSQSGPVLFYVSTIRDVNGHL